MKTIRLTKKELYLITQAFDTELTVLSDGIDERMSKKYNNSKKKWIKSIEKLQSKLLKARFY